ncbi:MAG: ABC transporter ATP-binding protein [Ignavibacteria bacterium]|nr:ABC transporter ATP-binding protein [Ignavibacteria bacterium]
MIELECLNLEKKYSNKQVFRGVNIKLKKGDSVAIIGRNGSGKSTLLKIISNLIKPTSGQIILKVDNIEIKKEYYYKYIGYAAPYLNLYDELTAYENLKFFIELKCNFNYPKGKIEEVLKKVNLYYCKDDIIREYSTGMKQRLKLAFSILNEPKLLLLDEPHSNLDLEGIEILKKISLEQKERGILLIATNELLDSSLCNITINIENY